MAGPAKLSARPALALSPAPTQKLNPNGMKLANVAVIQPGDRDVYKLNSTPSFDDRNGAGSLGRIHTPFKK